MPGRLAVAFAAALAAACALAAPSFACGQSGYAYAGVMASRPAHGVSARLTAVRTPTVQNGHVAAWVGIGGAGLGPHGSDEWLQVGVSAFPGEASRLYYEVAQPGSEPRLVKLGAVHPGASHRVAVLEVRGRAGVWRVWVDGHAASKPLYLPGSHERFAPVATAESWDGGVPSCNTYTYRFDGVRLATRPGGVWQSLSGGQWLQDAGYRVRGRSLASFVASRA